MVGVFYFMKEEYLKPILNENDLVSYENFINSSDFSKPKNQTFSSLLKNSVGKNIKIYIVVGNGLTAKYGKLLSVFDDYIMLFQNREKTAIKLTEIKFISVM